MSNKALSLLLSSSSDKFKKPTKEVEITRLSELVGEPFVCTVQAIDMNQFKEILRETGESQNAESSMDAAQLAVKMGLVDPKLTDKELQKHFNAPNYRELMNKMFLTGEIMELSEAIMEVSKLNPEEKKKVKKK